MHARVAEFFEQAEQLHGARHEHRLAQVLRQLERFVRERGVQQVFRVKNAAEIVEVLAADEEDGLRRLPDDAQVVAQAVREVEPDHLRARRHERVCRLVAEMEHAVDHVLLRLFERAVFRALLDEVLDLVLRDRVLEFRIEAEDEQDDIRRARQERDERLREAREARQRLVMLEQHFLRLLERRLLRQKFAEQQHDVRHDDNGNDERDDCGVRQECEMAREQRREQHAGRDAGEDAHERDADLRDGQRVLGRFEDRERGARILGVVAVIVSEAFEPALVAFHERRLDEREKTVEQEQENNQDEQNARFRTVQIVTHPFYDRKTLITGQYIMKAAKKHLPRRGASKKIDARRRVTGSRKKDARSVMIRSKESRWGIWNSSSSSSAQGRPASRRHSMRGAQGLPSRS